jgi:hypothetical protein
MRDILAGFVITILIMLVIYDIAQRHTSEHVSYRPNDVIMITKQQEGHITYMILTKGNSIHVVNYTADSLEYEFLHQPTKTNYGDNTDSAVQVR